MADSSAQASVEIARPLHVVDAALFGSAARGEARDVAGLAEITREGPGDLRFVGEGGRAFTVDHDPRQGSARNPEPPTSRYAFRLLPLSPTRTRVDLEVVREAGLLERAHDAFGGSERQLRDDLAHLRDYVEGTTQPSAGSH